MGFYLEIDSVFAREIIDSRVILPLKLMLWLLMVPLEGSCTFRRFNRSF